VVDTSKFKKCENGHWFDPKQNKACPHCPRPTAVEGGSPERSTPTTRFVGGAEDEDRKTVAETNQGGAGAQNVANPAGTVLETARNTGGSDRRTRILSEVDIEELKPIFGWMVVLEGSNQYEVFRISQEQTYLGGNDKNDIVLSDEFISSEHASIRYRDGTFFITDLDSSNGTFVNKFEPEDRIDRVELKDGDDIRIGQMHIKFKCI
jgi:hypothetical protein